MNAICLDDIALSPRCRYNFGRRSRSGRPTGKCWARTAGRSMAGRPAAAATRTQFGAARTT